MSQPQPERHSKGAPYTDPAQYEQQTSDGERAGQAAPEFSWFHRTTPGIVSQAVHPPLRAVPSPGRDDHAARHALHIVRPGPRT